MTKYQLTLAAQEAPAYANPDAFASDLLLSAAFLPPEDETAQPDVSADLTAALRALWTARNRPFAELLRELGKRQTDINAECGIPLRTLSGWVSGTRTPPDYIPILIVRVCLGI